MRACERLLKYVRINTQSSPETGTTPSTPGQWELARLLVDELKELGLENPSVNEFCTVTAWLPATTGLEHVPALGLLAHLDTAPAFSGKNVNPIVHENYGGGDIVLPKEGRVIRAADFPWLSRFQGKTVITADGSTLLGADDKAGIAEIMTLCETLIRENLPHGRICVAFTPDEEIGQGTAHFDVKLFGADFAYTVDGDRFGHIEDGTFNAAGAKLTVHGVSAHPGSAKGAMVNAMLIAFEFQSMLPVFQNPMYTEGEEGFFHLEHIEGDVEKTVTEYIIRDHDRTLFEQKKQLFQQCADFLNRKYGEGTVEAEVQDSYYNMKEVLEPHRHLIENAAEMIRRMGTEPEICSVRGGTDGARLSYMGLPCPNLCTGGGNFHSRFEYVCVQSMEKVTELLVRLAEKYGSGL